MSQSAPGNAGDSSMFLFYEPAGVFFFFLKVPFYLALLLCCLPQCAEFLKLMTYPDHFHSLFS